MGRKVEERGKVLEGKVGEGSPGKVLGYPWCRSGVGKEMEKGREEVLWCRLYTEGKAGAGWGGWWGQMDRPRNKHLNILKLIITRRGRPR